MMELKNINTQNTPLFIGSKKEFNKYFSGYGRNLVQAITKKHKKSIGKCEHCGTSNQQLDSAHVRGKERKDIINQITTKFESNGIIKINLSDFEQAFISAHNPINETIKILCKPCHIEYDNKFSANFDVKPLSRFCSENAYETTRLMFKKEIIESLNENDSFTIYLRTTNEYFTMTKNEFYDTFSNVAASDSYKLNGIYSYTVTPKKAYQYLSSNRAHTSNDNRVDIKIESSVETKKIGNYIKQSIKNLWDEGFLDIQEIERLQSLEYSKITFNGSFEIFRMISKGRKDNLGYLRYYKNEIIPGYLLSSQWYIHQKNNFDNWVLKLKNT